jgi:precorrin-6Y C5,15-methyltransferase (decarboxylating)
MLAPLAGQHLWDLGAGCGSVAIEWLRAAQNAQGKGATAQAVERDSGRTRLIAQNAIALGAPYLDIITAPIVAAIDDLAPPDAIFIGGGLDDGDGEDATIPRAWRALRSGGRVVANAVTVEGELALLAAQARLGGDLTRIGVSHAAPIGTRTCWRPAMTVTQWIAQKS